MDVILRRVDDSFCDPIELRSDSFLGVAGLVEAVRAGNVAVANALGSGLIETAAFMPFLPGLSRAILGEPLKLPSVATWWCGQPEAFATCANNLDHLVIKPAFPSQGMEPVFGGQLAADERAELIARMQTRPSRICRAGVDRSFDGSGVVRKHSDSAAGGSARVSGGGGRLVGGDAGRTCPRVRFTRHAGRLHAARRRQQRHLGAFGRAGRQRSPCGARAICRWI